MKAEETNGGEKNEKENFGTFVGCCPDVGICRVSGGG